MLAPHRVIHDRIHNGQPFTTRELANLLLEQEPTWSPQRALASVSNFIQAEKVRGAVESLGARPGTNAYLWRLKPKPPAPEAPLPAVKAPVVHGPYDPPVALEGRNSGLTEGLAGKLWREIGGGGRDQELKDGAKPMEADGWRRVARGVIAYLGRLGFTGPGGPPRDQGDWECRFVNDASNWEIVTDKGEGVALVLNETDVPLLIAAPTMRTAIIAALEAFDAKGGVKKSHLEALRQALPK